MCTLILGNVQQVECDIEGNLLEQNYADYLRQYEGTETLLLYSCGTPDSAPYKLTAFPARLCRRSPPALQHCCLQRRLSKGHRHLRHRHQGPLAQLEPHHSLLEGC